MTRGVVVGVAMLMIGLAGCLEDPVEETGTDPADTIDLAPIELPDKLAWRQLTPQPTPRAEHAAAVWEGKIYSMGGYYIFNNVDGVALGPGAVISLASMEIYDIATDTWTAGPDYPTTINHHAMAAWDGFVYSFKGGNSYKFDIAKSEWVAIAEDPTGAVTASTDPDSGKIYVAGTGGRAALYDPATDSYQELPEYPTGRSHVASAVVRGHYYIGNGDVRGHSVTTASLEEYDPVAMAWTTKTPNPVNRGSTVGTSWMGRFVVLGGQNQTTAINDPENSNDYIGFGEPSYDDVHAYDPLTDTWTELPPMTQGRHGFGAVTWEGKIYAVAGAPQEGVSGFGDLSVLGAV